jgi:hypothetical protein
VDEQVIDRACPVGWFIATETPDACSRARGLVNGPIRPLPLPMRSTAPAAQDSQLSSEHAPAGVPRFNRRRHSFHVDIAPTRFRTPGRA